MRRWGTKVIPPVRKRIGFQACQQGKTQPNRSPVLKTNPPLESEVGNGSASQIKYFFNSLRRGPHFTAPIPLTDPIKT